MRKIWSIWSVQMKKYVSKKWSDGKLHPCTIRFKHTSTEIRPDIKDVSLHVPVHMMCCSPCYRRFSLRSKLSARFRSKKDRVTGFSVAKTIAKKWKRGEGKEGNALPYFLPRRLPVLLLAPICAWSLTLVPRSLLRNQTESLLRRLLLLQTLSCDLTFMVPFTHLVLQSLQCFSKVVRVHFSVNTEAFETDSKNNTDTDS